MSKVQDHNTDWNGIIIRCDEQDLHYPMIVKDALAKIASRSLGRSLLRSIHTRSHLGHRTGYTVCIRRPGLDRWSDRQRWANRAVRGDERLAVNGVGTVTAVDWNPYLMFGDREFRPPFIALAHELIHAMNNLRGTAFSNTCEEEMKTVGLGNYENYRRRNENAIRAEHGLPRRDRYTGFYPDNRIWPAASRKLRRLLCR